MHTKRIRLLAMLALVALGAAACATGTAETAAPRSGGPAYAGRLRITPDQVRLEDTPVGCQRRVTLQIENTDPATPVAVTAARLSDPALGLSETFPLALEPGARRSVDLLFAPSTPGTWSGTVGFTTDEQGSPPLRLEATAVALAPRLQTVEESQPLDLVFVLDVSTTMYEMASLRRAILGLFDFVQSSGLDARFGLTTFVNDVHVHRGGAFLDRAAFLEELDSQLVPDRWIPDPEMPRQLVNFDLPENILDALHRSATDFAFRPDARRYLLLMTDDNFLEPPAVFSDGTPARFGYDEVGEVLAEKQIRLFAVQSSDRGQGFSSDYEGRPSLVTRTGGTRFELSGVESGALTLDGLLADLAVGSACE